MKIITCASFYGTGSSAITDLFSEYDNIHPNTEFEFRFAHDPDGLMDLEYHLVENFNREGSGFALKRFYKFCKYNNRVWFYKKYCKYFGKNYIKYSREYIDSLTDFSYKGFWHFDLASKGKIAYCFLGVLFKIFYKLKLKRASALPKEITYCSNPGLDKFLKKTQDYTSNLLNYINNDNKEYLVIDQLLPSTNTAKAMRYFKYETFAFIVDRDPRDVYMLCKTIWRGDRVSPHDSVENWCKWYRYVRENSRGQESDHIKYINFEDLIFNYEKTVNEIEKFIGTNSNNHIRTFTKLNPKKSVINTQIYLRNKTFEKDIKIIEELLPEFLYSFPTSKEDIPGLEVKNNKNF